jgi:MFS family permease
MMLFVVSVFTIFSAGCALSNTIETLIVLRAFQGIGGGGIMSLVLILLADLTPPSSRAAYMAPIGSMFALASVAGPLLGGFLTDGPGWRYAFWINVPIGVVCIVILLMYVPRGIGQQHTAKGRRQQIADAQAAAAAQAAAVAEVQAAALAGASGAAAPALPADAGGATATPAAAAAGEAPTPSAAELAASPKVRIPVFHESELEDETIDYLGSLLIVAAVICLCLALVWCVPLAAGRLWCGVGGRCAAAATAARQRTDFDAHDC